MTLTIRDRVIDSVCIVDDNPENRNANTWIIEDLNLQPVPADGPLGSLDQFLQKVQGIAQAAICDYMLSVKNYATFNGAQLVAQQYQNQFPAVLYTKWEIADIAEIRQYRRFIPVLVGPDELDTDSLVYAFERCIEEFHGEFQASRRSWRTLVRVENVDYERGYIYVIVPGWDPKQGVKLLLDDLPSEVREGIDYQERFHAQVNIGAEANEDLYFEAWEVD
jgi:CheY-like chemotaxis protein